MPSNKPLSGAPLKRRNSVSDVATESFALTLASNPFPALGVIVTIALLLAAGFSQYAIETSVAKLWVETGSVIGEEIDYTNAHSYANLGTQTQLLTTVKLEDGSMGANVLNEFTLDKHLQAARRVRDITIEQGGHKYGYEDVCYSLQKNMFQCVRITILDCFKEGAFDFTPFHGIYALDSVTGQVAGLIVGQAEPSVVANTEDAMTTGVESVMVSSVEAMGDAGVNVALDAAGTDISSSPQGSAAYNDALISFVLQQDPPTGVGQTTAQLGGKGSEGYVTTLIAIALATKGADLTVLGGRSSDAYKTLAIDLALQTMGTSLAALGGQGSDDYNKVIIGIYLAHSVTTAVVPGTEAQMVANVEMQMVAAIEGMGENAVNGALATAGTDIDASPEGSDAYNAALTSFALQQDPPNGVGQTTAQLGGKGSEGYVTTLIGIALASVGGDLAALGGRGTDAYNVAIEDFAVAYFTQSSMTMAQLKEAGGYDVFMLQVYWFKAVEIAGADDLIIPPATFSTLDGFYGEFVDAHCPALSLATGELEIQMNSACKCQSNPSGITPYAARPSFYGASPTTISEAVSNECYAWDAGVALPKVPKALVLGKPYADGNGTTSAGNVLYDAAEAYEFVLFTDSPEAFAQNMGRRPNDPHELTDTEAKDILTRWQDAFIDVGPSEGTDHMDNVLAEKSFDDVLATATDDTTPLLAAGLTCIFVYAFFTTGFSLLALGGVCLVVLGCAGGIGLSLWFGIKLNATSINVLPFLMLGLGVDDMFLFIRTLFHLAKQPKAANMTPEQLVAQVYMDAGPSVVLTTITNFCAFMVGTLTPLPVVRDFALTAGITVFVMFFTDFVGFPALCVIGMRYFPNVNIWNTCCQSRSSKGDATAKPKTNYVKKYVVPFLAHNVVRVFVCIFFVGIWGFSAYGITQIEMGLSVKQVTKKDSQYYHFYTVRDAYFGFFPSQLSAYENDFSDPEVQQAYIETYDKILAIEHNSERTRGWLNDFLMWADPNRCEKGAIVIHCGQDMRPPCVVNDQTKLFDAGKEEFNTCLNHWNDQTTVTSSPSFFPLSNEGKGSDFIDTPLEYCTIPFFSSELWKTTEYVDLIDEVRDLVDEAAGKGINLYPEGTIFTYWEQYRNLYTHLKTNLAIATGCTFIIGTFAIIAATAGGAGMPVYVIALKAMQGSAIMTLAIASTIFSLLGFMGLAGIQLSAIPALTVIACMGICVDLTALVTLFFCSSPGTRDQRITAALECVFIPTLDSMCSTIVGCMALAFSQIPLFVMYFFVMYVLVAVIGTLNGLVLLPVMLTIFGPTSNVAAEEKDIPTQASPDKVCLDAGGDL